MQTQTIEQVSLQDHFRTGTLTEEPEACECFALLPLVSDIVASRFSVQQRRLQREHALLRVRRVCLVVGVLRSFAFSLLEESRNE